MSSSKTTPPQATRVGIVQFDPKIEDVQRNIEKVYKLTEKIEPGSVDLLCLPEMAFTGYVFPTAASILPYIEYSGAGPSTTTCANIARRLKCHIIAGYPAPPLPVEQGEPSGGQTESPPIIQGVARNSALVVDPNGNVIHIYAKTNMFESDLPWAQPGNGFSKFSTSIQSLGTISVAICMDLNPHPPNVWTSMDGPYELADYCVENGVQTLVLLCAWLNSGRSEDQSSDGGTVNYWAARLRPLWLSGTDKYTVIICNRTGNERGRRFAGSSTVMRSQVDKQVPKVLDVMGRDEEAVRILDIFGGADRKPTRGSIMDFRA